MTDKCKHCGHGIWRPKGYSENEYAHDKETKYKQWFVCAVEDCGCISKTKTTHGKLQERT